ncbi:hypothetical protein pb186bvf_008908, partial [Paramecium bursaria]
MFKPQAKRCLQLTDHNLIDTCPSITTVRSQYSFCMISINVGIIFKLISLIDEEQQIQNYLTNLQFLIITPLEDQSYAIKSINNENLNPSQMTDKRDFTRINILIKLIDTQFMKYNRVLIDEILNHLLCI